jgi:serine/threonine protein kinase/tetratricopeptide (TPR) repeat protein
MIGEIISHYKILEKLGEGGMGIIFKAEDLKLKRTVALKVLPESFTKDEESKRRFIHEAQAASSIQHNNICTIHEFDESKDGKFFIAMDYYEGETLKDKIRKELLNIDEIIDIITQIAEGLKKAHDSGIIHRDIKPANIYITKDGTVKILDFGLAKKIDQTQFTRTGIKFGTTDYMSPEQIKGEKIDHRTDIWSLGVLLYEMLTGKSPFHADYEQTIVYLILNEEPEDASNYRTDVPERFLNILEKSIAKNKNDRYEDLGLMIDDLRNVMNEKEIEPFQFEFPAPRPSQSIAVLPFINIDNLTEQESFCDGLTEELINALSKISDLRVVARTSTFAFKGGSYDIRKIGRKLGVKTVLEGSVRKSGDSLRVTAQLINVNDGYHLWSERYEHQLKDIFVIQDEITLAITGTLKVKLLEKEKERMLKRYTDNIEAYNFYQQGYYFFNQLNLSIVEKSIKYFYQAIEIDPDYALAYCGLAGCYFALAYFGLKRTREVKSDIKKFIQKALEIDDNISGVYHTLALYTGCMEWNQSEAESAYKRSLELDPNDVMALQNYSINRVINGHIDAGRKLALRAKSIDPLSDYVELGAIFPEFFSAKYDLIVDRLFKFQELNPPFLWGLWFLWRTLSFLNRKKEAIEACKNMFLISGLKDIADAMEKAGVDNAFFAAANVMAEIYKHQFIPPYNIATLFSHAGKQEEALFWIEKSFEEKDTGLIFLLVDPEWKDVRNNDYFIKWMQKVGLIS